MKSLLDESAPRLIKTRLPHLSISTVQEMGWAGKKNGELLTLAAKQFDIFITADQDLPFQQNLSNLKLAFIILPSNQVPVVIGLLSKLENAIRQTQKGVVVELPLPSTTPKQS